MSQQTFTNSILRTVLVVAVLVSLIMLIIAVTTDSHARAATMLFSSPVQTPVSAFVSPLPTPTRLPGPSAEALKALAHIAKREKIPGQDLAVVNDYRQEYPLSRRTFQVVTVLDMRSGRFFDLLVDLSNGRIEEDIAAIQAAEERAYRARYGKLQPALYERLQTMCDDDTVPIAVWIAGTSHNHLAEQQAAAFASLTAKYPQARVALERSGKPMDVDDPLLARQIETEYILLLTAQAMTRTQPLIANLQQQGFVVTAYAGMPTLAATLPKHAIRQLARRNDVASIYLIEMTPHPGLDSAVPTSLAPAVWARGIDGTNVTIGILEHGNVDRNNTYLHHAPNSRTGGLGVQDHTTRVASAAASFHNTYRGIAYGATILSAGHSGPESDFVAALQWAFDQGAYVVNVSEGYQADNNMNWTDRAFDYWARARLRTIAVLAHNTGNSIRSPGKAWNIITVGATDDNNTVDWGDDQMAPYSAYINPTSPNGDREKPEVVAVGTNVTALGVGNAIVNDSGTSFATPQVAGLAALLIHRNPMLASWPEASKAIIMASATHNITGPTGIPTGQDLRDGAGAINAALADTVAQTRNTSDVNPCTVSCWWGLIINNTNFPVGTYLYRYFTVNKGDLVRVAISWWSNADTPTNNYSFDRLDTDLHLGALDPDGQWAPGAWSASHDNNYELIEFVAPKSGTYRIAVYKTRADEASNFLGIAFVRLRRVYIPLVLRSFQ